MYQKTMKQTFNCFLFVLAKQSRIDEWSRGTAIVDKNSGQPLQVKNLHFRQK